MNKKSYRVVSLFSGAGGLDLGFKNTGYDIIWANDYDKKFWETFEKNFPETKFDRRSVVKIANEEIPDVDGIIGGPPCQSWSLAGSMKGINDHRGQLFYEYMRILKSKMPLFFLAENVPGIVSRTHYPEFQKIVQEFEKIGYEVTFCKVVAADYGVPQERSRVIIVGFRKDLNVKFSCPKPTHGLGLQPYITQADAFGDLPEPLPARAKNKTNGDALEIPNHEYFTGAFSSRFMSRSRIRAWNEIAFTVEASGRHAKLYPKSAPMIKKGTDSWVFDKGTKYAYRRLSARESARIQGFPDNFKFYYENVDDGYKMIGNAVPVKLAQVFADEIKKQLSEALSAPKAYPEPQHETFIEQNLAY